MNVTVTEIQVVKPDTIVATVRVGNDVLKCRIRESNAGGIVSYNFDSIFFDALFHFDGIGARFSWDYWPFRRGEVRPLPWDYGDHDPAIVEKAEKHSGVALAALRNVESS